MSEGVPEHHRNKWRSIGAPSRQIEERWSTGTNEGMLEHCQNEWRRTIGTFNPSIVTENTFYSRLICEIHILEG